MGKWDPVNKFRCYEGHAHASKQLAQACDAEHWRRVEKEFGLNRQPLHEFEPPPVLEQVEMFDLEKTLADKHGRRG